MLELDHVSKNYEAKDKSIRVVQNLSLVAEDGKFIALVGPSGCGKTTLLKMIAGLIEPTSGTILVDNKLVTGPGSDRGMIFQDFTLFPWLKVRDNIAFGLDMKKISKKDRKKTIDHYLKVTGLVDFVDFYPKDLSGGMQQKVAIARTLATNPKILLMDEPFASLDSHTRSKMQEFLTDLWEKEKKTVVFVTHDVSEAIFLADTVHVLSSRPTTIKKTFEIPFPRPRKHDLKHEKEFFELTSKIAKELEY
ncbi:ABC transporter ATP-binding protein [Candidatus Kaiserbacteria bacterium]|nr:ABC transporter ATP-binding protein [Candidatus Kaiserbacteria bacterium]